MPEYKRANLKTDTVVWEEGMIVEGEYTDKDSDVGPNNSNIYKIRKDDGKIVSVWGTTVLDANFDEGNEGDPIPLGALVRITCEGKKAGKVGPSKQEGKGYWSFIVEFAMPSPSFKKAGNAAAPGELERTKQTAPEEDGY